VVASWDKVGGTPMGRPLTPLSITAEDQTQLQVWSKRPKTTAGAAPRPTSSALPTRPCDHSASPRLRPVERKDKTPIAESVLRRAASPSRPRESLHPPDPVDARLSAASEPTHGVNSSPPAAQTSAWFVDCTRPALPRHPLSPQPTTAPPAGVPLQRVMSAARPSLVSR
jgi:hypothetical protein